MRYIIISGLALVIAALDQFSKALVAQKLSLYEAAPVTSFFNLVHVRNRGAAFGFLNDPGLNWQIWLFGAAALVAAVLIIWLARKAEADEYLLFTALGCIMGGAVGNLIDRLRLGAVVDFLDFHIVGLHWPAFNVADIAICVGAGLTALLMLRQPKARKY